MNEAVIRDFQAYLELTGGDKNAAASLALAAALRDCQPAVTPGTASASETLTPRGLTVQQAARRLGTGIHTVYGLCRSSELPHYRIGKAIRILPESLDQYEMQQAAGVPCRPVGLDRHRR